MEKQYNFQMEAKAKTPSKKKSCKRQTTKVLPTQTMRQPLNLHQGVLRD